VCIHTVSGRSPCNISMLPAIISPCSLSLIVSERGTSSALANPLPSQSARPSGCGPPVSSPIVFSQITAQQAPHGS
jgi:hypothetical protein